jgi:hypothetical protein
MTMLNLMTSLTAVVVYADDVNMLGGSVHAIKKSQRL